MPQINPTDYERATAIITHATLSISIQKAWPELSSEDRDAMFIGVLDRIARMRGFAIRREYIEADEDA